MLCLLLELARRGLDLPRLVQNHLPVLRQKIEDAGVSAALIGWQNGERLERFAGALSGRIEYTQRFDLVSPEFDSARRLAGGKDVDDPATTTELTRPIYHR